MADCFFEFANNSMRKSRCGIGIKKSVFIIKVAVK